MRKFVRETNSRPLVAHDCYLRGLFRHFVNKGLARVSDYDAFVKYEDDHGKALEYALVAGVSFDSLINPVKPKRRKKAA